MSAAFGATTVHSTADREQAATRTVIVAFSFAVSLAGIEHGVGEILEGPVAPPALVFESWPDTPAFAILNGEPAMTVIPNLLVTGVLAIAASIAFAWWAVNAAHRPRGALGLVALSVILLLTGGGLAPPAIGLILALAASRIGSRGRTPGSLARRLAGAWRPAVVLGLAGYLGLFPGMVLASAVFGFEEEAAVVLLAALAFGGLFTALAAARAHDRLVAHGSGVT